MEFAALLVDGCLTVRNAGGVRVRPSSYKRTNVNRSFSDMVWLERVIEGNWK